MPELLQDTRPRREQAPHIVASDPVRSGPTHGLAVGRFQARYHGSIKNAPNSPENRMAAPQESVSMALFCDFENVALGVRDAKYEKFEIRPVLERLLLKGSIVVKKAYCDWDRYKGFKASMHEASFELIEIPHVRQSGKNSADIRLVVDALDLCYTKSHVDTFVIISGDSDFSPLVSKLRENDKKVIGVGVKQSTSELLVANCDEFIFYDDLVREQLRAAGKHDARQAKRPPEDDRQPRSDVEARRSQAITIAVETFEALAAERGESGKIWASVLKSAIKRRKPGFSETHYGFKAFGNLLEEAQSRGLIELGRDEKSGAFVFRSVSARTTEVGGTEVAAVERATDGTENAKLNGTPLRARESTHQALVALESDEPNTRMQPEEKQAPGPRRARKTAAKRASVADSNGPDTSEAAQRAVTEEKTARPARKASSRSRPPRKSVADTSD